ncbi:hypothetical protein JXC34_02585 [Candidatus Woesearchaeota archaeon]|nr:hypothetical protein [Candidatus Woesearchaeota archaeon]
MINETQKRLIVFFLILFSACLSLYFHFLNNIDAVFTHFFYIPILLSCLWWKRKGIIIAALLGFGLVMSHLLIRNELPINDILRAVMFIIISILTAFLSEKIWNTEKRLRQALKEKDILLKEVNHRVKNNLQFIASMLNLQAGKSKRFSKEIKESRQRIMTIAGIHEMIYKKPNLNKIDLKEYITSLVNPMSKYCNMPEVGFEVKGKEVSISMELSLWIGLIINELVTNSLKYAFPDKKGKVIISIDNFDDKCLLTISDNGIGIKKNSKKGFGLELVDTLVQQIKGSLKIETGKGTTYKISFSTIKNV